MEPDRCNLALTSPEPCVAPQVALELRPDGRPIAASVKNFSSCSTSSVTGALFSLLCRGTGSITCAISAFPRQGPAQVEGAESWSALELLDGSGPALTSLPSRPKGSVAVILLGYTAGDLEGLDAQKPQFMQMSASM